MLTAIVELIRNGFLQRNGQILADKMWTFVHWFGSLLKYVFLYLSNAMKGKKDRIGATPIPDQSNNEKPKSRTKKDRTRGKWRRYVARQANRNRLKAAKSKEPYVSATVVVKEMDAEPPPPAVEPQGVDSAQSPNDSFSDASAIEFRDAHTKIAKELADTTKRIPEPVLSSADLRGVQLNIDDTEGAAQLCAESDVGISAGDVLTSRGNEFDVPPECEHEDIGNYSNSEYDTDFQSGPLDFSF